MKKKKKNRERYQTCLYSIHRDGRLKFIQRRRDNGKALGWMPTWNPNEAFTKNPELKNKSILPKFDMLLLMYHTMKEALESSPEGEKAIAVKHALYKLAKEFGVACESRHGMVYWTCKNPPCRRAFAFQIQVGRYSKKKAKKLLGNKAIYRCVIDIDENSDPKVIAMKRRFQ